MRCRGGYGYPLLAQVLGGHLGEVDLATSAHTQYEVGLALPGYLLDLFEVFLGGLSHGGHLHLIASIHHLAGDYVRGNVLGLGTGDDQGCT